MAAPKSPLNDPLRAFAYEQILPPSQRGITRRPGKTADDSRPVHRRTRVLRHLTGLPQGQPRIAYLTRIGVNPLTVPARIVQDSPQRKFPTIHNPAVIRP
jgi:hypothetical protein